MAVLFRYELKKLFSRKMVWIMLALCMAYVLLLNQFTFEQKLSGRVQGIRDIYSIYDGCVVTEAFKKEVTTAFNQYIIEHPEHFVASSAMEDGVVIYFSKNMDYYSGALSAFNDIGNHESVESLQDSIKNAKEALARGNNEDGSPLQFYAVKGYMAIVKNGFDTPVVHYAQGWNTLYIANSPVAGAFILFLLALGLLPLFNRERSSRMESVLLCSTKRVKAAEAKMLVGLCYASALAILFFGLEFLVVALTYGLDGASLPMSAMGSWYSGSSMTIGEAYTLAAIAALLAAVACGALVSLASALFRHPLAVLLCAGAFIAIQFVLSDAFNSYGRFFMDKPLLYYLQSYIYRLPAVVLIIKLKLVVSMAELRYAVFLIGFPALLTGLIFWLAPRHYLKQRKA